MESGLKKILKAVTLELRHLLEGQYDSNGKWQPGDLEQRLAAIGVRRDRESIPVDEIGHLSNEDRQARSVVDAYLKLREEAGVERREGVADFVRETAYTWANRLMALRCMEARELIDPVILQQDAYGGRSLEHHRLAQRQPELCAGDDDGLFAVLDKVFREQAGRLSMLFDPMAPGISLRPSPAAIKDCLGLLSLQPDTLRKYGIRIADSTPNTPEPQDLFIAPDALGWTYQYWNTEEKERVLERIRTVKGAKIAGADIIPATQLYTERYMVRFLVQNSLGAIWVEMHPESKLAENWEYYVKGANRTPIEKKPAREITFLDPACGSGHFLLEAFDLLYAMYLEEGELTEPVEICDAILTKNLFGIDIDARAVQIAEVALWMRAAEQAFDYQGAPTNLVAANASHLKGEAWEEFLQSFEQEPSVARVLRKFAQSMENVDEIGSLARPAEDLREIISQEHATWERQVRERKEVNYLFAEMSAAALSGQLPFHEISDDDFGDRLFYRARAVIDTFTEHARKSGEFEDQLLGSEARAGFRLMDLLSRRYDVVAANPPYMSQRNMGAALKKYVTKTYDCGGADLYTSFIEAALPWLGPCGRVAMVTSHTFMFLPSYHDLRQTLFTEGTFESLIHYGTGIMKDLSNPNAQGFCSWVFTNTTSSETGIFLDARELSPDSEWRVFSTKHSRVFKKSRTSFADLPGGVMAYWIPDDIARLFRGPKIQDVCSLANRTKTGENEKFVRFVWEISSPIGKGQNWLIYQKGGEYQTYAGNNIYVIKWSAPYVANYREDSNCRVTDERFTCRSALTYNGMGQQFSGRITPPVCTYDVQGPALVGSADDLHLACAVLNSPFGSYVIKALNPSVSLQSSNVLDVPVPSGKSSAIAEIVRLAKEACALKGELVASDMLDFTFSFLRSPEKVAALESQFVSTKSQINQQVCKALGIEPDTITIELPIETVVEEYGSDNKLAVFKHHDKHYRRDQVSHAVLCLLGHRWPEQLIAHQAPADDADPDGIIPLTIMNKESMLIERLRQRLAAAKVQIEDFADVAGKPLDTWLTTQFFEHHAKQFKKRPIAWQLQSGKFTAKKAPAFACLVYYHKLDADTLPKLRSQYVGPLRQRLETELRGIESVAADARSDRQEKRRIELQDAIKELSIFDGKLQEVVRQGFARPSLAQLLANEPLDRCCSLDGIRSHPATTGDLLAQESAYAPDINDGVRVNIAPLQKAGLLAADVLAKKDLDKAIADRAQWRADERRWVREGKLPNPGWWPEEAAK